MKRFGIAIALGAWLGACGADAPELALQTPDRMRFEIEVYPRLLRDCGFPECHASHERFFQVFGPGRGRLDPLTEPLDPPTPLELDHAYERTRSMIDAADPERSLLLRKPLATAAGGSGHEGVDQLGRNVYPSKAEPAYLILQSWVIGPP